MAPKRQDVAGKAWWRTKFSDALASLHNMDRPVGYPGLTSATRRLASDAQLQTFARTYDPGWRHTKLQLFRFLLEERLRLVERFRNASVSAERDPDRFVFEDLSNGLLASAASEYCQYAEDLSVLLRALRSDGYFARDITSPHAGKVQNDVEKWVDLGEGEVAELLFVPKRTGGADDAHSAALRLARDRLHSVSRTYAKWFYHYIRYKHGLGLALRHDSPEGSAARDQSSSWQRLAGLPIAFDGQLENLGNPDRHPVCVLPDVSDVNVRCNAADLAGERNLLRLVYPLGNIAVDIDEFVVAGLYVAQLQRVALRNRLQRAAQDGRAYYLPAENAQNLIRFE